MFGSSRTVAGRMALVVGGLAMLATVPVVVLERLPALCLFERFFDHACLGCGLSRSMSAWLHGDVAGAQAFHPAGPWIAMVAFACVALDALMLVRNAHRGHAQHRRPARTEMEGRALRVHATRRTTTP